MSITSASIPIGATIAPSGGTATALSTLGNDLTSRSTYVATAGVTLQTRTEMDFAVKPPKVSASAPAGYTQARATVKVNTPKVLSNAKRTINSIQISLSVDPETTEAEVNALKSAAALLLVDSDFSEFFLNQSLN